MSRARDAADLSETGHITIVASMIVFVLLTLFVWALIWFQIHTAHKRCLADLESGAPARGGTVDDNIALEDVLRNAKRVPEPDRSSHSSWPASSTSGTPVDSEWYTEERPVRSAFDRIGRIFHKKKRQSVDASVVDASVVNP
ncbi:hypothetical protein F5Y14DRAFT_455864 [Nemania sp. NC0429]|nr:hypothetical protein F5Y14DRAFT_455864 [Nemania sp. NC0429]